MSPPIRDGDITNIVKTKKPEKHQMTRAANWNCTNAINSHSVTRQPRLSWKNGKRQQEIMTCRVSVADDVDTAGCVWWWWPVGDCRSDLFDCELCRWLLPDCGLQCRPSVARVPFDCNAIQCHFFLCCSVALSTRRRQSSRIAAFLQASDANKTKFLRPWPRPLLTRPRPRPK